MSLKTFLIEWLTTFKQIEVKPRSFEWYCNLAKPIISVLGEVSLRKLTAMQIQDFFNIQVEGKKTQTVKRIRDLLNQALTHAEETKLIDRNPIVHTKLPKAKRQAGGKRGKAIPIELRSKILSAAEQESFFKPVIFTLMFTGMRTGELLALPWKNINLKSGTNYTYSGFRTMYRRFLKRNNLPEISLHTGKW